MINMSITGIKETFLDLEAEMRKEVTIQATPIVHMLTLDLKAETPVDTGHARDSWTTTPTKDGFDIANPVEYIDYLNQGSSKQAPAFFIETTALKYGTPKGAIVEPL